MQDAYRTFDGVAVLGSSLIGTTIPARPGVPSTDWGWAFHWQEDPGPPELAALIAADVAAGLPTRHTAPEWASLTYPGFIPASVLPGAVAGEAARIDVPVLLATGERDVCHPPAEEVAALKAATDISVLVVPRMAHMHNFAATRALLWDRLDEFVTHVTRMNAPDGRRADTR
jgi:pimeloyl-ACP methyl ester carboxylesterase